MEKSTRNKVTFCLKLGGKHLSTISLSALEYEEIRTLPFDEAIGRIMKKDPQLREDEGISSQFIRHLGDGNYIISEASEGGTER